MRIFLVAGISTLAVVLVLAVLGVVVAPDHFTLPKPEATVTVTATPQVVATVTATATVTAVVTPAPAATSSPESGSPVHWTKVTSVSGTAHKKSARFWLRGDAQRLSWKLDGGGQQFAQIYVTEAFSGEFSTVPDAAPDYRGPGSTRLHLEEGMYYLDVYSDCTWSVTIWDQR